ncbi:MAG: HD domain-containing protein [Chitinophagales bacterium]
MNLATYLTHPIFATIRKVAAQSHIETYVVGGFVRDLMLKRTGKDIDFVCVGSGIELAEKTAAAIHPKIKVSVFRNFGTAHFATDGWDFEFVGARKESYQRESRNPIVESGTLTDDQNRRDFTINAMAISLNDSDFGELVDPFGGLDDIASEVIRTPLDPDITFSDDPLRMMRAIRFASQLNFYIDDETLEAIARNKERIKIISQERITDELNKIILSKKPSVGFRLLEETGLLQLIFPEMQQLKGVQTVDDKSHKDNFYHTLQVLDNICFTTNDLWLRWAAILHDIAKPVTKRYENGVGWTFHGHEVVGSKWVPRIFRHFKLPLGNEMKLVQKLVYLHLRPIALSKEEITDSALRRLLFEAGDDIESLMKLCEADITSKNKVKVSRFLKNFEIVRQKLKDVEERDSIRNFQPPVSGEMIMQTFGIGPSREVGVIKDRLKEAILEGEIRNDFEEAHALMLKMGAELGLKKLG